MAVNLSPGEWDRMGHSRRMLLLEGVPAVGRSAARLGAYILGCELALIGVEPQRAWQIVGEGMMFSPGSTPEYLVRRRALPEAFTSGYLRGLSGHGLGCCCTWRERRAGLLYEVLRPYCGGSCFPMSARLEPWMMTAFAQLARPVERDVYYFCCRHVDSELRFWVSATYATRGLNYVHSLRSVESAMVTLERGGYIVKTGQVKDELLVPGRRVVRRRGDGDAGVYDRGRVQAGGFNIAPAWCHLGADARDVYGLAAAGVAADVDAATRVLSWLPRRRVLNAISALQMNGLLSGGRGWRALPAPEAVLAEGRRVAAGRELIVRAKVERGQERLVQHRRHRVRVLAAA